MQRTSPALLGKGNVHCCVKLSGKLLAPFLENGRAGYRSETTKCNVQGVTPPLIFREVLISITDVLGARRLQALTTPMLKKIEEGNVVTRKVKHYSDFTAIQEMLRRGLLTDFPGTSNSSSSSTT